MTENTLSTAAEDRLRDAVKAAIRTLSLNRGAELTTHTMRALEDLGAVLGAEIREQREALTAAAESDTGAECDELLCRRPRAAEQLYCSIGCALDDANRQEEAETDVEFGPQTALIRAVIESLRAMSAEDSTALEDYMVPDGDVAWRKARRAMASSPKAPDQARWSEDAKWAMTAADEPGRQTRTSNQESRGFSFAGLQAYEIARALILRDTVSREHYDVVTRPWRLLIGRIHPDDAELGAG